jgi:hypothetical protein
MKQISVALKDEPGALAGICDVLGKSGVNIITLYGGGNGRGGYVHLVTNDERTAENVLRKAGLRTETSDVITTKMLDRPGELAKCAYKLAHAGVNISSVYLLTRERGEVTLALSVDNVKKAQEVL